MHASHILFMALAAFVSAQTVFDDGAFTYTGDWTHDVNGPATLYQGTQSWTNDPTATFSLSFEGTGFDFCAGLKADRGDFTGATTGTGTEIGSSMQQAPRCQVVASARNLDAGKHTVVFSNSGATYFAADSFTVVDGADATTTSSSPSSTQTLATSSKTSAVSSSVPPAAASPAGILPVVQKENHMSASKKAAMIALPLLAGIFLSVLGFYLFIRHQRRRAQANAATATDNFDSMQFSGPTERMQQHDFEKGLVMIQKPVDFGNAQNPTSSGRKSPLGFNVFKPAHSRLQSQLSLESHTEPFQPEALSSPPIVDPFVVPEHQRQSFAYGVANGYTQNPPTTINGQMQPPQPVLMRGPSTFGSRNSAQRASEFSHYPRPQAGATLQAGPASRTSDASHYASSVLPDTGSADRRSFRHSNPYAGMQN